MFWTFFVWQLYIIIIRLGLKVALDLTHHNRSYRDRETKENVEAQKGGKEGETTGRRQH